MKHLFLTLITMIAFSSCADGQQKNISAEAKSKKLMALDGTEVALSQIIDKHAGKTIVIEVWASWCGDCVKAMPKLKAMQLQNPAADYVFISMDRTEAAWRAGIEKHELTGDHYWAAEGMKGSFAKAIDLDWIPRYMIIDKNGQVVTYRAIETDFDALNATLKTLE